ncbi:MAG TPA: hypothetical protein VIK81_02505, partial [Patescibacteria group bacterium]
MDTLYNSKFKGDTTHMHAIDFNQNDFDEKILEIINRSKNLIASITGSDKSALYVISESFRKNSSVSKWIGDFAYNKLDIRTNFSQSDIDLIGVENLIPEMIYQLKDDLITSFTCSSGTIEAIEVFFELFVGE